MEIAIYVVQSFAWQGWKKIMIFLKNKKNQIFDLNQIFKKILCKQVIQGDDEDYM